ncbi:hypothetical protein V8C44DRAFT_108019 [Trichoderma aethiopicum]
MRVGDFFFPVSIVGMAIPLFSLQICVSILNTPFPFHLLKRTSCFLSECGLVSMYTLVVGPFLFVCCGNVYMRPGDVFMDDGLQTPCRPCISRLGDSFLAFFSTAFSSYFASFMIDDGHFIFGGGKHQKKLVCGRWRRLMRRGEAKEMMQADWKEWESAKAS